MTTNNDNNQPSQEPTVERAITHGLWQKPAYLLIFGICFIGITAGSVLAATGQNVVSITLAFSVVLGLGAATIIILKIERPQERLNITGSNDIDAHLISVCESLKESLRVPHPQFRAIVVQSCARLDSYLADIRNGQVRVSEKEYNSKMHEMLSAAQTSVFCVHRGDYLGEWFRRIGKNVIRTHEHSAAAITHIFVFDDRKDLTVDLSTDIERLHKSGKMEVLVYFDRGDDNYRFPEDFPRDYCILDGGDAICVTDRLEKDGFSGKWYFNDNTRKATFNDEFAKLKKNSIKYDTFQGEQTGAA